VTLFVRLTCSGISTVTIEIEASLPQAASDQLIRTVAENSRTLKFTSYGLRRNKTAEASNPSFFSAT
jgi:hypothetical protein